MILNNMEKLRNMITLPNCFQNMQDKFHSLCDIISQLNKGGMLNKGALPFCALTPYTNVTSSIASPKHFNYSIKKYYRKRSFVNTDTKSQKLYKVQLNT